MPSPLARTGLVLAIALAALAWWAWPGAEGPGAVAEPPAAPAEVVESGAGPLDGADGSSTAPAPLRTGLEAPPEVPAPAVGAVDAFLVIEPRVDGEPVPGAQVWLGSTERAADAHGRATFSFAEALDAAGRRTSARAAAQYGDFGATMDVLPCAAVVPLALRRDGALFVRGEVVDAAGSSQPGLEVEFRDGGTVREARTDEAGRFAFEGLQRESMARGILRVRRGATTLLERTFTMHRSYVLQLELPPTRSAAVEVSGVAAGEPIELVVLAASDGEEESAWYPVARFDAVGPDPVFVVSGLPVDAHVRVSGRAPGRLAATAEFLPSAPSPWRLDLSGAEPFLLRLPGCAGRGAVVSVQHWDGARTHLERAEIDVEGAATIRSLKDGVSQTMHLLAPVRVGSPERVPALGMVLHTSAGRDQTFPDIALHTVELVPPDEVVGPWRLWFELAPAERLVRPPGPGWSGPNGLRRAVAVTSDERGRLVLDLLEGEARRATLVHVGGRLEIDFEVRGAGPVALVRTPE